VNEGRLELNLVFISWINFNACAINVREKSTIFLKDVIFENTLCEGSPLVLLENCEASFIGCKFNGLYLADKNGSVINAEGNLTLEIISVILFFIL
jgi:hypothetical protein